MIDQFRFLDQKTKSRNISKISMTLLTSMPFQGFSIDSLFYKDSSINILAEGDSSLKRDIFMNLILGYDLFTESMKYNDNLGFMDYDLY